MKEGLKGVFSGMRLKFASPQHISGRGMGERARGIARACEYGYKKTHDRYRGFLNELILQRVASDETLI